MSSKNDQLKPVPYLLIRSISVEAAKKILGKLHLDIKRITDKRTSPFFGYYKVTVESPSRLVKVRKALHKSGIETFEVEMPPFWMASFHVKREKL